MAYKPFTRRRYKKPTQAQKEGYARLAAETYAEVKQIRDEIAGLDLPRDVNDPFWSVIYLEMEMLLFDLEQGTT